MAKGKMNEAGIKFQQKCTIHLKLWVVPWSRILELAMFFPAKKRN